MRRRVGLAGAAVISLALVACELIFPFDGYGPGAPDAGGDGAALDASDGNTPAEAGGDCTLARWPSRPNYDDPPTGSGDLSLFFVADSIDLGLSDAGPIPGFDLDGVCTCPGPPSCAGASTVCDHEGGADQGGNDLLLHLSAFGSILDQSSLSGIVRRGSSSFLIDIRGYNGAPNDTNVQLALYSSGGTTFDDGGTLPDGGPIPPRFDGTDVWSLDKDSVVGGDGPPYLPKVVDAAAYVANGTLVAQLDFPLNLRHAVLIQFREGVFAAHLAHDGAGWRIDHATIAGRWPRNNLLGTIAALPDPFVNGGHLCGDSGTYQAIKPQICGAADIATAAVNDGKGTPCDAFGVALAFTASSAIMGGIGSVDALEAGCGPDYQDECSP